MNHERNGRTRSFENGGAEDLKTLLLADAGPYAARRLESSSALKVELMVISSV